MGRSGSPSKRFEKERKEMAESGVEKTQEEQKFFYFLLLDSKDLGGPVSFTFIV